MKITKRSKNNETEQELIDSLLQMQEAKQLIERAERDLAFAQERVIKLMEQSGNKTTVVDLSGTKSKITVVEQERLKINDTELRNAIGEDAFNLVTVRKVDTTLLKAAVTNGTVDANVMSKVSTITKSSPYVRISVASAENE